MKEEIQSIPLDKIRVLNPRSRSKKFFAPVVESIRTLGLKKPIKVSHIATKEGMFDLVYGQGRLEAFRELGYESIPAIVVDIPTEDRLLMSLVENMARRFPRHGDLILEIRRQFDAGVSQSEIARKLGMPDSTISGYITLSKSGEERLLQAAVRDLIPIGVAMDIARTGDLDSQRELMAAYENKQVNQGSIRVIKRIIDQRRLMGKTLIKGPRQSGASAETLIRVFRRDAERKKVLVRKARQCENRLVFIEGALRKLMADENFRNLLRAEKLSSMPDFLAEKINVKHPEAA